MKNTSTKDRQWYKDIKIFKKVVNQEKEECKDLLIDELIDVHEDINKFLQEVIDEVLPNREKYPTSVELRALYKDKTIKYPNAAKMIAMEDEILKKVMQKQSKRFKFIMEEGGATIFYQNRNSMTKSDHIKLTKTLQRYHKSIMNEFEQCILDVINIYNEDRIIYKNMVQILVGIEETDTKNCLDEIEDDIIKTKSAKIFDYKEMIKLVKENNYKIKRQTGSHIICEHSVTNKIVVIPAHDLKYGLMCAIQKQIQEGCK